ncbi:hypothetical protein SAMN02910436_02714 [Ruminococcaceae bacterium P7]|nr:hypothetical protein SAMN02910436_02714 [Ruminococcaceae bacterium P7]
MVIKSIRMMLLESLKIKVEKSFGLKRDHLMANQVDYCIFLMRMKVILTTKAYQQKI